MNIVVATGLAVVGWSVFVIAVIVGLFLDLIGLFGNWIILGAAVIAWGVTGMSHFSPWGLVAMAVLALIGEGIEMVAAGYGAKKFGGSKGSIVAAIVGCIVGSIVFTPLIPIPLVGTLIGAIAGSFIGAAMQEYLVMQKHHTEAAKVGFGAALGKVGGVFGKLLAGFAIVAVVCADLFYFVG